MDGLWATNSEGVGLIIRVITFQYFQANVITIQQRHRRTDGRTDGRYAIAKTRFAL